MLRKKVDDQQSTLSGVEAREKLATQELDGLTKEVCCQVGGQFCCAGYLCTMCSCQLCSNLRRCCSTIRSI